MGSPVEKVTTLISTTGRLSYIDETEGHEGVSPKQIDKDLKAYDDHFKGEDAINSLLKKSHGWDANLARQVIDHFFDIEMPPGVRVRNTKPGNTLHIIFRTNPNKEHSIEGVTGISFDVERDSLKKLGLAYVPSVTNFILVDVGRDCVNVFLDMLKYGVIVRDMKQYGLKNFIRVTIGTKKENERFIKVLKKIL